MLAMDEPAGLKALERSAADAEAANQATLRGLAQQGVTFGDGGAALIQEATVRTLKALWIGEDPARAAEFDLAYQAQLAELLTVVQAQVNREKLASNGPRLLRP